MQDRLDELFRNVESGVHRVEDLADRLAVSTSTVRRDLTELERVGKIVRTHGGAVLTGRAPERSLHTKSREHGPAKQAIASAAAALVEDGHAILLGAGSTSALIAESLADRTGLTVYTNGIGTLLALRDAEHIDVRVLGGCVRWRTGAITGTQAREALRRVNVDLAFVGADGFVPGRGINTFTEELAALKEAKLHSARHRVIIADSSKVGEAPYSYWCPVDGAYTLLTDDALTASAANDIEQDPGSTLTVVPAPAQ